MDIKLDIVTPTLNSGKYLENTIISTQILRKQFASHICVDSGSTDDTLSIINRHSLTYIVDPPGNMYRAVNKGFEYGNAKWCTYINSDDILYESAIMNAILRYGDSADVIYGNFEMINEQGRLIKQWESSSVNMLNYHFHAGIMPFSQPGTLFRRSLLEELGGFSTDTKYSSDFDFFLRAFLNGARFVKLTEGAVSGFRMHKNQISQVHTEVMRKEKNYILDKAGIQNNILYYSIISKFYRTLKNSPNHILGLYRKNQLK